MHTYSSLDPNFINQYAYSLSEADEPLVFYDPEALKIKKRKPIDAETIKQAFACPTLRVFTEKKALADYLLKKNYPNEVLVMMSSGNFGGLDWEGLKARVLGF